MSKKDTIKNNQENAKKELTPKNDVIFKRLFGKVGRADLLKDFLESILNIEISNLKLRQRNTIIAKHN